MTVFKAIKAQADATARLAALLAAGDTDGADAYADKATVDPESDREIPSVLLDPEVVTADNVKDVVDGGYVTAEQLCTADLAARCEELGIK
jgi:D-xylose transport system substrate-binding protein